MTRKVTLMLCDHKPRRYRYSKHILSAMTTKRFLLHAALLLVLPTASAELLRKLKKGPDGGCAADGSKCNSAPDGCCSGLSCTAKGGKCEPSVSTPIPTPILTDALTAVPQPKCGCDSCTAEVLSHPAGGSFPCGDRIDWKMTADGGSLSEEEACRFVSNEYPADECGPFCHPDLCQLIGTPEPSPAPTESPTASPTEMPTGSPTAAATKVPTETPTAAPTKMPQSKCGCDKCTAEVLSHPAGGSFPCGDRIDWKMTADGGGLSEEEACRFVSNEYPNDECGPYCHPDLCHLTPEPSPAPTANPTEVPTQSPTESPTAAPTAAPTTAPTESPTESPTATPTAAPTEAPTEMPIATDQPTSSPVRSEPKYCGCHDCTDEVWAAMAGAYPCGDRITYMKSEWGGSLSDEDACAFVSNEFPSICGPYCDPSKCDDQCPLYAEPYKAPDGTSTTPPNTLLIEDPLYCYPDYNQRKSYTNTFGGTYVIEAKDGQGGPCGPGDNAFTSETVSYDAASRELTLEYKNIGSSWKASEVRILKSDADPTFGYGTYSFSLKSVKVYDASNTIVSSALPSDLVLGLFTWDTTEDYATNVNWNHEVDVEISQWGDSSQINDVQFLVQPHHPGGPHFPERLSSGGQGGNTYEFTWEPTEISWYTTAGGGQGRQYSTQIAKDACTEDYIQCLPANVEVRLNLWDMNGATPEVSGLTDGTRVEVIIDDFSFNPSAMDHAPDGDGCSKNCQCAPGSICGASATCEPFP